MKKIKRKSPKKLKLNPKPKLKQQLQTTLKLRSTGKAKLRIKTKSKSKSKSKSSPTVRGKKTDTEVVLRLCHLCLVKYDERKGHTCVPVTEADLLGSLDEDLRDAFLKLKRGALEFGDQRVYNNAKAIMFSRRVCYMFVRLQKRYLELCFFLPHQIKDSSVHRILSVSKTKFSHMVKLIHPDQVESPLTDWLFEAFEFSI